MIRSTLRRTVSTIAGGVGALFLAALLLTPQQAQAQRWLQTTQVIAPIQSESATRALLDTLINVIERKDSLMVRRSPEESQQMVVSDLQDQLLDNAGIGLSSANQVFIDYRFAVNRDGFEERITALHFIFRPAGGSEEDIAIMYLDVDREKWVNEVLQSKGTTLVTNEAALKPFREQLAFARIVRDTEAQIVEIGDRKVREGFEAKKRQLVDKITRLTYSSR
jgi:hypothetical protein